MLFGFLKKEVEVDENLVFDTAAGRLNASDIISKIDELVKENEDLKVQLNCSGKKNDDDKDDDKDEKDEDKKDDKENCSGKDNCSGKKNEDEEKDEDKKDKAKDDEDGKDEKENEADSHEPSTIIPEAQAKANEEAVKNEVLLEAIPKVNDDERIAKVTVRGLSKKK